MAVKTVQAIVNGVTVNLALNSSTGLYEGNITAPNKSSYNINSGHYYPVTIKATDDAGNTATVNDATETLGSKLRLTVKEITKPVITITYPTEGQITSQNKPTINFTVTDNDSGVNSDTIGVTIDSGSKITSGIIKTAITGGYQCSYAISTSLSDGSHTVYVDANDNDGNSATQRTVNFTVDTVPPELSVISPTNNLVTNRNTVVVSGSARDVTTSLERVTVRINGGSETEVEVNADGTFSKEISLTDGANTIVITAIDASGISSQVTRIVTLDTDAPVITDVVITPNPVSTGEVVKISATVTD